VASAQAQYGCTSPVHCQYGLCNDRSWSSSSCACVNGEWKTYCVSGTEPRNTICMHACTCTLWRYSCRDVLSISRQELTGTAPGRSTIGATRIQTPAVSRGSTPARLDATTAPASLQVMRCPLCPVCVDNSCCLCRAQSPNHDHMHLRYLPLPLPHPHVFLIQMRLQGLAEASSSRVAVNVIPRNHQVQQGRYVARADDMRAKPHTHMRKAIMVYDACH
jgi:hypothetical protein